MRMFLYLVFAFCVLALYGFAGTSDQLDELTVKQQEQVVAWQEGR